MTGRSTRSTRAGDTALSASYPDRSNTQDSSREDTRDDQPPGTPPEEEPEEELATVVPSLNEILLNALRKLSDGELPADLIDADDVILDIQMRAVTLGRALKKEARLAEGNLSETERLTRMIGEVADIKEKAAEDQLEFAGVVERLKRKRAETLPESTRNLRPHLEQDALAPRSQENMQTFLKAHYKVPMLQTGDPRAFQDWLDATESQFQQFFAKHMSKVLNTDGLIDRRVFEYMMPGLANIGGLRDSVTAAVRSDQVDTWEQFIARIRTGLTPARITDAQLMAAYRYCRQGEHQSAMEFKVAYDAAERALPDDMKYWKTTANEYVLDERIHKYRLYELYDKLNKETRDALTSLRENWPDVDSVDELVNMARQLETAGQIKQRGSTVQKTKVQTTTTSLTTAETPSGPSRVRRSNPRKYTAEETRVWKENRDKERLAGSSRTPATGVNTEQGKDRGHRQ